MPVLRVNSCAAGFFALVFSLFVGGGLAADELGPVSRFVTGADEVPLMELLAEIPDSAMVFDKPGGRIVEVQAAGALAPKQVEDFYTTILPQLGWQAVETEGHGLRFRQEREILTIDVSKNGEGGSLVTFAIAPGSSPAKTSIQD